MHTFSSSAVSQAYLVLIMLNWGELLPVSSYSLSLVNTLVSFGLLLLYMPSYRVWDWNPPYRAPKIIISIFFLSNIFLVVVPFFPPVMGSRTYEKLPYWVCYFYSCSSAHFDWRGCLFSSKKSHTQLVALWYPWLVSHIGIYGVSGFRKGRDIVSSEIGLFRKTVSLDIYSAEYLGLLQCCIRLRCTVNLSFYEIEEWSLYLHYNLRTINHWSKLKTKLDRTMATIKAR